jgi:CRP-like cAMP-binding protein
MPLAIAIGAFTCATLSGRPEPAPTFVRNGGFSGRLRYPGAIFPKGRTVGRDQVLQALIRRLSTVSGLEAADEQAIRALPIMVRTTEPNHPIVRDGERPSECCLIVEGFCFRAKTTASGQRQILSIHIAGDIPDLQSLHLHVLDHDLVTLTSCTLGFISHASLRTLTRTRPRVAELLWRDTLVDAAIFREWIVNVGQRPAPNRLAHLLVELRERLAVIGRVDGNVFEMPLTQEQLADAMGITPVHVNRVLKMLREENAVEFGRGRVTVLDERKLQALADFDARYLHLKPSL